MSWKKDIQGNEYTSAAGAARFLGMARTTFMYYVDPETNLPDHLRPVSKVLNLRTVYYKTDLETWKNKTSKIKFKYKRNRVITDNKMSNVTNFPKKTNKTD
tara:strand:+ start:522 stop:824 length:303 start_codon:yes stop_codon:yes gene_type:complete